MPFGKHVGMTIDWIADNDPGYLVWMDEQGDFEVDPVLVETCRDAIEADARGAIMNTVIYHRADFDGQFSAAVCKKFLPEDTQFIGWDFGDPLIEFPAEGTVYLVDLPPNCFKSGCVDESRLIWIDHHKSSIEQWDCMNDPFNGYRIDGVAACRLCWQWFTADQTDLPNLEDYKERRVSEPLALTLAGEYDVWDLRDVRSIPFQFGLTAGGYSFDDGMVSLLDRPVGDADVKHVVVSGFAARDWQQAFASQVCKERSYLIAWEGHHFCVLASCHARMSTWFPEEAIPETATALMCWRYDGASVKFSLYHAPGHEEHDLSVIAKKYGGGGHKGACGFEMSLGEAMEIVK